MGAKDSKIPTKDESIPDNTTSMCVTNKHYITKNPIQGPFPPNIKRAVFGTGCFWGTEKGFWRLPGVYSTAVGYSAGHTAHPTYEDVCTGRTGHNEVVHVAYDPSKIAYPDLLRMFWAQHDPTQGMGQVRVVPKTQGLVSGVLVTSLVLSALQPYLSDRLML
eukprot:4422080-Pyramimonas_sp.AAC.2